MCAETVEEITEVNGEGWETGSWRWAEAMRGGAGRLGLTQEVVGCSWGHSVLSGETGLLCHLEKRALTEVLGMRGQNRFGFLSPVTFEGGEPPAGT